MKTPFLSEEKGTQHLARYRAVSLCLVAVAVLFRTLNLFFFYENDIGYYRAGTILPTVFRIFLLLATLFLAVYARAFDAKNAPVPQETKITTAASLLVAITFAVMSLLRYCTSATEMTNTTVFIFVTGGLAAVYFILFTLKKLSPSFALLTGFGTILWFSCILLVSYLDIMIQMNAPMKVVLHLATIGGMLLMLAEMHLACHEPKNRFYLFALSAGTVYLCTSSIPSLIADAAGLCDPRDLAYADFACLALGLFGIARLLSLTNAKDPCEPTSVDTPLKEPQENQAPLA